MLAPVQWSSLERDLRRRPDDFGLASHLQAGKLLAEHLPRHYDVKLAARQCQRLFRQMGSRYWKPHTQVVKSDPHHRV